MRAWATRAASTEESIIAEVMVVAGASAGDGQAVVGSDGDGNRGLLWSAAACETRMETQ